MPPPAHEGGGGVEEKPKVSGKREDPGTGTPAEEGILAPGHDGDLGHGGTPGDEKSKEDRPSNHPEEDKSEEKGVSNQGLAASAHGSNPDHAKQDDPDDLRDVIENADLGRLEDLLTGGRAKELLRQTYGGSDGGLDTCALFKGTLPLLHAAKCGESKELLLSVHTALKREGMLQEQLVEKDGGDRTVLHLAALSGDHDNLAAAIDIVAKHLDESQMLEMLKSKDAGTGHTVLMVAAASGEAKSFKRVRSALSLTLSQDKAELKQHLMEKDGQHRTLLHLAALSGNKDTVDAVWDACKERGIEATEMGSRQPFPCGGTTALMKAVEGRDMDKFMDEFERELRKAKEPKDAQGNHGEAEDLYDRLQDTLQKVLEPDHPELATRINNRVVLPERQVGDIISSKNVVGETLLSKAIESGHVQLFQLVRRCAWAFLSPTQRGDLVESKNIFGESLLAKAFDIGDENLFKATLDCAWEVLNHHQLVEVLTLAGMEGVTPTTEYDAHEVVACMLRKAFNTENLGVIEAALKFVVGRCKSFGTEVDWGTIERWMKGYPRSVRSLHSRLAQRVMDRSLSGRKVAERRSSWMDGAFSYEARDVPESFHADDFNMLFSLIANSARPSASELKELSRKAASGDVFKRCCLRAVTSAANPFIPGVTLSIRLSEAAKQASEGERRALFDTKSSIDEMLLEMFERLPQTVRGFEEQAGTDSCTNVLEPELMRAKSGSNDLGGPLDMIISDPLQLETFCKVPLIMDFLSSKFTLGLPDLMDTAGLLKNEHQLWYLEEDGLFRDEHGFGLDGIPVALLEALLKGVRQGIWDNTPTLTFLPGAQFIVAAMVAAPTKYYEVPAMRMLLDFVVYIGMVAVLSYFVLFHSTTGSDSGLNGIADHRFSLSEGACGLIFITAGAYREGREMKRGIGAYFKDQWNVLDALGMLFLFVGLVIRWDDWTSTWGPAFYALSAPLVVARVLFFAQILQFQGPMVQVIFRMTATLLQFGAVMLVVMIGFTMALHVIFRDVEDFGDTLLGLFKAMLGETGFFDEFSGGRYDPVATILVVVYLFIVTVMLLNLLIAILSTEHAQVQENTGGAFKVSKARIIAHYRTVVDNDVLPAPFNLVQLLLSLGVIVLTFPYCFLLEAKREKSETERPAIDEHGLVFWGNVWEGATQRHRRARRAFGRFVWWLVLGSVAVAGGAILWGLSGFFYAQYAWHSWLSTTDDQDSFFGFLLEGDEEPGAEDTAKEVVIFGSYGAPLWRMLQGLRIVFRFVLAWIGVVLAWFLIFLLCILGAPCCLFLRWLILPGTEFFSWCWNLAACRSTQDPDEDKEPPKRLSTPTIESMLKKGNSGVGAENLLEFLEDPMNDKDVRQDEKERKTTVEHIKLLRDRLEKTTVEHTKLLRNRLEKTTDKQLQELRKNVASKDELGELRNHLASKVQDMQGGLEKILAVVQELKSTTISCVT